jgi:hypothetical protein
MKFLEMLKKITGIDLSKLQSFINIKISCNIDRSTHVDNSTKTLIVNPKGFRDKDYRALQRALREDGLDSVGAILEEGNVPIVESVRETLPAILCEAERFLLIIPPGDAPLLKACLFLRKSFQAGAPVDNLKRDILSVYGTRGGNFANLCTAGYLETVFWPVYEQLLKTHPDDTALVTAKFRVFYNTVLNELPWTEFVSGNISAEKCADRIVTKMEHNLSNGVRYMNIHALSPANVKKVEMILPEIEKQTGARRTRTEREPNRIFVRLEIPVKALGQGRSTS